MSEDKKKRDRALQRRVRERQTKTGESYQAAWQQLHHDENPQDSGLSPEMRAFLVDKSPEELLRIQQALFDKAARARGANPHRVPLPLSEFKPVMPGQSVQITGRPQLDSFWPERLLIKNVEEWQVHEFAIGTRKGPQYTKRPLCEKGMDFSLESSFALVTQEVLCGQEIVLTATYTGTNEQGGCLEAVLFGWDSQLPPKSAPSKDASTDNSTRITERMESKTTPAGKLVNLPVRIKTPTFFVDRFVIQEANNWIVNDIRVRDRSIFAQAGDIPGEMFSESVSVILEPLATDDCVEVLATYIGSEKAGRLVVELSGTAAVPDGPRDTSYFLPMSTGIEVLPTQSVQITARPQFHFICDRIVIADAASGSVDGWIVNDIKLGNRSQFVQAGDVPAQAFSGRGIGTNITLGAVPVGQDVVFVATRIDDSAPFCCGIQGRHLCADR